MNNKFKGILIALLVVFIAVAIFVTPIRSAIVRLGGNVVSPIASAFHHAGNAVSGWCYSVTHAGAIYKENESLKTQVQELQNQAAVQSGLELENQRLRELLELRKDLNVQSTGAEIIARDGGNWFRTFTINKGSANGIKPNQPVLCAGGLVGHTTEVGTNWARVISVLDTDHAVSGMVVRSGDYVLVEGNLALMGGGKCKMINITENADVIAGDVIVSSGMGGVYPKNIVVGTVESFAVDETDDSRYAIIDLAVDFQRLHEVLVLQTEA